MPSTAPQPQLKKKASFRERLKGWQKPPQALEIVEEDTRPRSVYQPKHAAADFSRLAVSPVSPARQRLPRPMQSRVDDAPPAQRSSQRRSRNYDDEPIPRRSNSRADRHSYTLVEDPLRGSTATTCGPPDDGAAQDQRAPSASQPLSDYELFIARAEAEERARRERAVRSISQRSAAYSASRARPDPHRESPAGGGSWAAARSDGSQRRSTWGYATKSDSGRAQPPRQIQAGTNPKSSGHARHSSWAPSYATGGSASEKLLERKKSPAAQTQPPQRPRKTSAAPHPIAFDDDALDRVRDHQPQPPRTLRKQASFTQRIAEYIRPAKTVRQVDTLVE